MNKRVLLNRALRYISIRDREYRRLQTTIETTIVSWFSIQFNSINKAMNFKLKWRELERLIQNKLLTSAELMLDRVLKFSNRFFGYGLSESDVEELVKAVMSRYSYKLKSDASSTSKTLELAYNSILQKAKLAGMSDKDIFNLLKAKSLFSAKTRSRLLTFLTTGSLTGVGHNEIATTVGKKTKTWIYTFRSKKARPVHLALNMATIDIDERFNVDGYLARYPHDYDSLPLSERANCHCVVLYN